VAAAAAVLEQQAVRVAQARQDLATTEELLLALLLARQVAAVLVLLAREPIAPAAGQAVQAQQTASREQALAVLVAEAAVDTVQGQPAARQMVEALAEQTMGRREPRTQAVVVVVLDRRVVVLARLVQAVPA
jgi:hypothetical protein